MGYPVKVGSKFKFQGTTITYTVKNIANIEGEVKALCHFQSTVSGTFRTKWFKLSQIEKTFAKNPVELKF